MRFGFDAVIETFCRRRLGNRRCFVLVDIPTFLEGYNLFVPLMTAGLEDAPSAFRIRWPRPLRPMGHGVRPKTPKPFPQIMDSVPGADVCSSADFSDDEIRYVLRKNGCPETPKENSTWCVEHDLAIIREGGKSMSFDPRFARRHLANRGDKNQ